MEDSVMRLLLLPLLLVLAGPLPRSQAGKKTAKKPNIILIMADDLGWGEVGCYGQKKIKTPSIDALAKRGMRFTSHYSGNAVCAPSRCCLMTGKHPGHAYVRDNTATKPEGQQPLPEGTVTLARLLQMLGYTTGAMGKWGLGGPGSTGEPGLQGIDYFFGYLCQSKAHNHYAPYLWRNKEKVVLEGNDGTPKGKVHSHDLFEKEALQFITKNKEQPFFLFLPFTIPHVGLQISEEDLNEYKGLWDDPPYKGGKGYYPHPHPRAAYAAMVTRMDRTVGRIMDLLKKLDLDEDTLVIFTSDNGGTHEGVGGSDSIFFVSNGIWRGFKGSLFEGGLRVPFIAAWPGRIPAGRTTDLPCANWDLLPTLLEVAGGKAPKDTDGISILPTLLDKGAQKKHEYLYWEFPGYGGQQAVRWGDWKGIRQNMRKGNLEIMLFDLKKDPSETTNLAKAHPEIVARIEGMMRASHTPSKLYPIKVIDK